MTVNYLETEAVLTENDGRRLIRQIEEAEAALVRLRSERDQAFRRAAEMRVAINILREVGLRSETMPTGPLVAVDYPPQKPEPPS